MPWQAIRECWCCYIFLVRGEEEAEAALHKKSCAYSVLLYVQSTEYTDIIFAESLISHQRKEQAAHPQQGTSPFTS